jgi:hypothetical protein
MLAMLHLSFKVPGEPKTHATETPSMERQGTSKANRPALATQKLRLAFQ